MATQSSSVSTNVRLLPDDLRTTLIASLEDIDSKTPELPVKSLHTGKKAKGMGQASYGFASEMSLIIQSFPDLHSSIYDQTVGVQRQNLDDLDEMLTHLNKLQQRYHNARQMVGQQIMEMSNDAYANLKRRAERYPEYNAAYQKVKVFYEKSRREQQEPAKAATKTAASDTTSTPS